MTGRPRSGRGNVAAGGVLDDDRGRAGGAQGGDEAPDVADVTQGGEHQFAPQEQLGVLAGFGHVHPAQFGVQPVGAEDPGGRRLGPPAVAGPH
ncbi:hypothetical protein AAHB37_14325 [Glutamicibacter halophytocola]